jgi:hypothetical protein
MGPANGRVGADSLLGLTGLDERDLAEIARAVSGSAGAMLRDWWVEPVDYDIGSSSTAGLRRIRGVVADAGAFRPWSVFVKLLRSHRHIELPAVLEERLRATAEADLSWRHEADVYRSGVDDVLPLGLRLPIRYRIDDLDDDLVVEWLEDVRTTPAAWDVPRFERAARLLGRLAVRLTEPDRLPESVSRVPGEILRLQYLERQLFALPVLLGEEIWAHPQLADERHLRRDLHRMAERIPALLGALEGLPHTFVHGDASPQNLLVPADDPLGFVAVDWSLIGLVAVGYDLSQLVIGLVHAGQLDVDALPAIQHAVLPAYTAGLADEGIAVGEDVVRFGFHATLAVRSAFSALPLARLAGPPTSADTALITSRVRLTRHLVDHGLALPLAGP